MGATWRVHKKGNLLRCVETWHLPSVQVKEFDQDTHSRTFAPGIGLPGRVWSAHPFLAFRSFAFCFRAFAPALAALRALARRCSGVIVLSRALPPFLPSSARYLESSDRSIFLKCSIEAPSMEGAKDQSLTDSPHQVRLGGPTTHLFVRWSRVPQGSGTAALGLQTSAGECATSVLRLRARCDQLSPTQPRLARPEHSR